MFSDGFGKTVNGYTNFGKANDFITVIFPIKVNFRCSHCLRQFLKLINFGSMFFMIFSCRLLVKVILNVFAESDVQIIFLCRQYFISVSRNDPILRMVVFCVFSFNPDSFSNWSKISIIFSNDSFVPLLKNVASSQNSDCFISIFLMITPLISWLCFI